MQEGARTKPSYSDQNARAILGIFGHQGVQAGVADRLACPSVAYTYNDPTIFHEYAVDTAIACHVRGIKSIAV